MIIERARQTAFSNPLHQFNIDIGIVDVGDSKSEAMEKINDTFSDLSALIKHVSILHMAATFEDLFKKRLSSQIGDVRKGVRAQSREAWRENLVRSAESFDGLREIEELLSLPPGDSKQFKFVRDARNAFAHGASFKDDPIISELSTLDILRKALDRLTGND